MEVWLNQQWKKKKNKRGEKEFKGSLICLKGSMSFGADTVSNVEKVRKAAVAGRFKCDWQNHCYGYHLHFCSVHVPSARKNCLNFFL